MELSAFLLTLAVLVLVAAFLYEPFFKGYGQRVTTEERELSALLAERERTLNSLQELDFDFKLGKIPAEEYPTQRANLLQKGADILRTLDDLEAQVQTQRIEEKMPKKKQANNDALEALIAKRRAERRTQFDGFCPKCGKPVLTSDRFCPACGKALK